MNELLPWQLFQWEHVMQRKGADRLPHAVLCYGSRGIGKRLFAERLAHALLCYDPKPDGLPCGVCRACHLFLAGNHPDCIVVEPAEEGKPIKVDQVRELSSFLNYTSQLGGYKIVLLLVAERLNINAANSLLKTLEEPPARSVLLLVTAALSKLPATVRSRCQLLAFREPARDEAARWLAPYLSNAVDPKLLLSLANDAPLLARAYAEGDGLLRRKELFTSYQDVIAGKSDPVRAAERWVKGGVAENLRWLIGWYMDMIRLKMVSDPPRLLNPDLRSVLQQLANRFTQQTLFRHLDAAIQMHESCITQVNSQLMIESFLVACADE